MRLIKSDPHGVADVLDKAHDILLADGWCQLQAYRRDGANCLTYAIARAVLDGARPAMSTGDRGKAMTAEKAQLRDDAYNACGGNPSFLATWNDQQHRTLDDVLDRLRNTAKALRELPRSTT